jgi:hypothetical protein
MAEYIGDYPTGASVIHKFNTRDSSGAPITFAGSPALSVYKNNETAETTHGLTLTVDFDSRTGFHQCVIVLTQGDGYYATASEFRVVVTAGTVDSVSVVGETVFSFSIQNRSALRPSTSGRTLDVSAGGAAGLDWANVESPTSTVALTNTTVGTVSNVAALGGVTVYDSDFTLSAASSSTITLPATDAAGNAIPDSEHDWCVFMVVGGTGLNQPVLTTTRVGTRQYNLYEALTTTLDNTSKLVFIGKWKSNVAALSDDETAAANCEAFFDGTGYAGTNNVIPLVTTVTTLTNLPAITANWLTAAGTAADFGAEIADAVWDEDLTGHTTADSAGQILGDVATGTPPTAAAIADAVWDEATAGHTTSGTFGEQLKTDVDAIKAKTDSLTFTVAGQVDANAKSMNDAEVQGDGTSGDKWRGV